MNRPPSRPFSASPAQPSPPLRSPPFNFASRDTRGRPLSGNLSNNRGAKGAAIDTSSTSSLQGGMGRVGGQRFHDFQSERFVTACISMGIKSRDGSWISIRASVSASVREGRIVNHEIFDSHRGIGRITLLGEKKFPAFFDDRSDPNLVVIPSTRKRSICYDNVELIRTVSLLVKVTSDQRGRKGREMQIRVKAFTKVREVNIKFVKNFFKKHHILTISFPFDER